MVTVISKAIAGSITVIKQFATPFMLGCMLALGAACGSRGVSSSKNTMNGDAGVLGVRRPRPPEAVAAAAPERATTAEAQARWARPAQALRAAVSGRPAPALLLISAVRNCNGLCFLGICIGGGAAPTTPPGNMPGAGNTDTDGGVPGIRASGRPTARAASATTSSSSVPRPVVAIACATATRTP